MKLTNQQLAELAQKLNFLIGQQVKYDKEYVTVIGIQIIPEEHTLQLILKEGLPHGVELFMWLDNFIQYNPEYAHLMLEN